METPRRLFLIAGTLFCLTFSSCREGSDGQTEPQAGSRLPNVVMVVVDTLRADHLSCYGYGRRTSPFVDSLAEGGCLFLNCSSTSSWTSPAVASLLTGLYPRSHGVRHGFVDQGSITNQETLDSSLLTLAEALRGAGYSTFGVSANGHISRESGMARGFDTFVDLWFADAEDAHRAGRELKEEMARRAPWFFWIFYFDPHLPYRAQKPWVETYASDLPLARRYAGKSENELKTERETIRRNRDHLAGLVALYDSEINYTDDYIRRLFEEVLPEGDRLVIVTADHGEGFFDHGNLGHGKSLYGEEVRIPLIIREPGSGEGGCRIAEPVSLIDVFPTILDSLDLNITPGLPGRSLLPLLDRAEPKSRSLFLELDRGQQLRGVTAGKWKLVRKPGETRWGKLFNLEDDPGERTDLLENKPRVARRLDTELERWQETSPSFEAPWEERTIGEKRKKVLKSLGYIQ